MSHPVNPRRTFAVLLVAAASLPLTAAPALAVDSATCTAPNEPHAGRQFTLSAQTSPITGNYSFTWDLDNNGSFETNTGTESSLKMEKATAGTYTFGVTVTDDDVAEGDPKREARGTCQVTVVNDLPTPYFEIHPVEESFPTAWEALRFTYSGSDNEDDVNQRPISHAIDFDGDGQFEFTDLGNGEVYASFPAGFDKDVTHRITDAAGASVDSKIRIKPALSPFGFGTNAVLAPLGEGTLPKVTATAPKSIKRKTLLKKGIVATFQWGPTWGRVEVTPAVRRGRKTTNSFVFRGDAGYAPGERVAIKPLPPQLKGPIRRGAKTLLLRWKANGKEGAVQEGTITVRIKR